MERETEKIIQFKREGQTISERKRELFFERLFTIPETKVIDFILEQKDAAQIVRQMPFVDLYWLIKKIGEDDSIPILRLATEEQWQYILDMEVWNRDRLDIKKTSIWLRRFLEADPDRLANWLVSEDMELFIYYYLYRMVEVVIATDDNIYDLPEDYFTLDGTFYLRLRDERQRDMIETILKLVASQDFLKYQALLMTSRAILPASTEEELYRLRSVRIAEYGFLPFEEAIAVYSPIPLEKLKKQEIPEDIVVIDEEIKEIIPHFPMYQLQMKGIFSLAIKNITDNVLIDRLKLEFAGLCNQIISADGLHLMEFEDLIKVCKKAAGYLNIAIEKLCGDNISEAIDLIKRNSLVSIFRAGFGIALRLRWKVERWVKESWFKNNGLNTGFWGPEWGEIINGLLMKKPMYYVGIEEGEEFRHFERLSEIERCEQIFEKVKLLDQLFSELTKFYPLEKGLLIDPTVTFHPFIFTFWARQVLMLEKGFQALSLDQIKEFFKTVRKGELQKPYKMKGYEERFIKDISSYLPSQGLKEILSELWKEFVEEYESVEIEDLDERYLRFFIIR